jgi:hypothetical protein
MAGKRASSKPESNRVFGQARKQAKMFRAGLYARVSTNDQQTIPLQMRALREYAARWGWTITPQVEEVGLWAARGDCADNYGGRPPSEYRCHRVLATEPLGTVGRRSIHNASGTGAPRYRLHLPDRSAESIASWSRTTGIDAARQSRHTLFRSAYLKARAR